MYTIFLINRFSQLDVHTVFVYEIAMRYLHKWHLKLTNIIIVVAIVIISSIRTSVDKVHLQSLFR